MRLPGGPRLKLRQPALAAAIAAEWQVAGGQIDGHLTAADVPLTSLAGTAQERIVPDPAPTVTALAAYAETDLLCYRAEQPETLVRREHLLWQPWLDWASAEFGADLIVTSGAMPVEQPRAAVHALHGAVAALDPFVLAGLGILVPIYGSVVLGLAVAAGALDAQEAYRLSILDELFEETLWGVDDDAAKRRAHVERDVADAARFMALALQ